MNNSIEVLGLSKTYRSHKKAPGILASLKSLVHRETILVPAVKSVSFQIASGELVGFLGPNGAGKTTTLKMLSGILYPTAGRATVLGFTPWKREKAYQRQFALVMGQKNQLWWDLPAMDSFLLNKAIYEVSNSTFHRVVDELSKLLDITDILHVPVRKLSLGQRMKCELVAALIHEPKVLFLDEPTIGLDVVSQQAMRNFIRELNVRKKTTIVLTSHYMEDVEALCDRVIIIDHGSIVYDGRLRALIEQYADQKILEVTFTEPVTQDRLEKFGAIKEYAPQHVVLEAPRTKYKNLATKLLHDFPVDDIFINEIGIEEVIRQMFSKK